MPLPLFPQPLWPELQYIMKQAVEYHGKLIDLSTGGTEMPFFFEYIKDFVKMNPNVINGCGSKIFCTFVDIFEAAQISLQK